MPAMDSVFIVADVHTPQRPTILMIMVYARRDLLYLHQLPGGSCRDREATHHCHLLFLHTPYFANVIQHAYTYQH